MSTSTSTNHSNTRGYSFRQRNTIKNISWKGNLNARLAHLLSDHGLTLPTLATCAEWADVLGIGDHDPTGRRVARNIKTLTVSWLDSYKMACNEGVDSFADMDEELRALVLRRCAVYEVLEGCLKPEVGEVGRGGLDESDAREAV